MRRLLLALLLIVVAGCAATPAMPASAPLDPYALVGAWRVDGSGNTVLIDADRIQWRSGGQRADGSWRADAGGRFLAGIVATYPGPVTADTPIVRATAFGVDGEARELRGPDGAVLVRLLPADLPADAANIGFEPLRRPTPEQRRAAVAPAPLPAGLRPADPTGRWVPEGWTGPTAPGVEFRADGTVDASDGCNAMSSRWVAGSDGNLLVAGSSAMTLIGCTGVDVPAQVGAARRAAFDGNTLVLLDGAGSPTGRFTRA